MKDHHTNIVGAWVEGNKWPEDLKWKILRLTSKGETHYHLLSPEREFEVSPIFGAMIDAWAYITGPNFKIGETNEK